MGVGAGTGQNGLSPIGGISSTGAETLLAPRDFIATHLRVELQFPHDTGERTFRLTRGGLNTNLSCTITAPDTDCVSNRRVRFDRGEVVGMLELHTNVTGTNDASFGWVAQKG